MQKVLLKLADQSKPPPQSQVEALFLGYQDQMFLKYGCVLWFHLLRQKQVWPPRLIEVTPADSQRGKALVQIPGQDPGLQCFLGLGLGLHSAGMKWRQDKLMAGTVWKTGPEFDESPALWITAGVQWVSQWEEVVVVVLIVFPTSLPNILLI